jgi:hypothetical protein
MRVLAEPASEAIGRAAVDATRLKSQGLVEAFPRWPWFETPASAGSTQ